MSRTRPPNSSGPLSRHLKARQLSSGMVCVASAAAAAASTSGHRADEGAASACLLVSNRPAGRPFAHSSAAWHVFASGAANLFKTHQGHTRARQAGAPGCGMTMQIRQYSHFAPKTQEHFTPRTTASVAGGPNRVTPSSAAGAASATRSSAHAKRITRQSKVSCGLWLFCRGVRWRSRVPLGQTATDEIPIESSAPLAPDRLGRSARPVRVHQQSCRLLMKFGAGRPAGRPNGE